MVLLVLLLIFLAASLGLVAGYSILADLANRDGARASRRVNDEFQRQAPIAEGPRLFKNFGPGFEGLSPLGAEGEEAAARASGPKGWRPWLESVLLQAGLKVSLRLFGALTFGAALLMGALGGVLSGWPLGLAGALLGAAGPALYVRARWVGRRDTFLRQLPGAFELMARVLKAGHSVPQAFQSVSDSFEGPLAAEFAFCREQQNLGLLPEVAFHELAQRTGVLEMRIFSMAMLIQRQTGGNLSEVLERLGALIRERVRLRNHIKTLTAEGRLQAVVLLVLPFVMFLVMRFINRAYADVLLDHVPLLAATGVMMGLGALWIRRIINIDI